MLVPSETIFTLPFSLTLNLFSSRIPANGSAFGFGFEDDLDALAFFEIVVE